MTPSSFLENLRGEFKLPSFLVNLLTGIFFLALGFSRLGTLVRFVPYPVVSGFLAGTGGLLVKGGLNVMTGLRLDLAGLGRFTDPVVGAIGMYTGTPATASVVAAEKTVMYGLRAASLVAMEREYPDVAAAFHNFIAKLLAVRLTQTNQSLEAMMQ